MSGDVDVDADARRYAFLREFLCRVGTLPFEVQRVMLDCGREEDMDRAVDAAMLKLSDRK